MAEKTKLVKNGEQGEGNPEKIATIVAKPLAIGPDGNRLQGKQLAAFLKRANELERLVRSLEGTKLTAWRIGNILYETKALIHRRQYRQLLNSLRISRRSAARYVSLREAWSREDQVPPVATMELYAEARKKKPAKASMVREPRTNPSITLVDKAYEAIGKLLTAYFPNSSDMAKTAAREKLAAMKPNERKTLQETLARIIEDATRLAAIVGMPAAALSPMPEPRESAKRGPQRVA